MNTFWPYVNPLLNSAIHCGEAAYCLLGGSDALQDMPHRNHSIEKKATSSFSYEGIVFSFHSGVFL